MRDPYYSNWREKTFDLSTRENECIIFLRITKQQKKKKNVLIDLGYFYKMPKK